MRLGIITSHPIQYHAPLFRALAERVDLHVYFAHRATEGNQAEAGFGLSFAWDNDLTSGYRHSFLHNVSPRPSIVRFEGCDTPDVSRALAVDQPDVLVVFGWHFKSFLQAASAARALGIPVMVRTDSHLDAPRPLAKRVIKSIAYPLFLRRFNVFLPTGTRAAAYLRHYRVSQSRIRIVPCCIDVDAFKSGARQARENREQIRAGWGAVCNELALLFVGKFIDLKRAGDLLDAAGTLVRAGRAIRVVLVGAGPLESKLRQQASDLHIPATFAGFVNQSLLPKFYAAADLLVLPSQSETWGLVVNEAFACGLPAIVSDQVGCAPDMIRHDVTGRTVPVGDGQELARAIEEFRAKVDDRAVVAGLAAMTEHYSPCRSAEGFIAAAEASLTGARTGELSIT
jgi:glycosyltransferase involved in cell wall biosynthesis